MSKSMHLHAQGMGRGDKVGKVVEVGTDVALPFAHPRCMAAVVEHLARDRPYVHHHVREPDGGYLLQIIADAVPMAEALEVGRRIEPHHSPLLLSREVQREDEAESNREQSMHGIVCRC